MRLSKKQKDAIGIAIMVICLAPPFLVVVGLTIWQNV